MAQDRVKRSSEAGFTMIEVMIAVLLTAIAVIGIVGFITVETRGGTVSRHTTEASVLAEDKMETLRTQTITASGTGADSGPLDPEGKTGTGGIFTRSWAYTVATASITFSVTVTWSEDDSTQYVAPPKTVTLQSMRGL